MDQPIKDCRRIISDLPREGSISSIAEKSKWVKNAAESVGGSIPSNAQAASAGIRFAILSGFAGGLSRRRKIHMNSPDC